MYENFQEHFLIHKYEHLFISFILIYFILNDNISFIHINTFEKVITSGLFFMLYSLITYKMDNLIGNHL